MKEQKRTLCGIRGADIASILKISIFGVVGCPLFELFPHCGLHVCTFSIVADNTADNDADNDADTCTVCRSQVLPVYRRRQVAINYPTGRLRRRPGEYQHRETSGS